MVFDDLFAQCQPNTRSAVNITAVQALEDDKNLVGELLRDADAVVGHGEDPVPFITAGALVALDDDPRRDTFSAEFHRVANQVLPHHYQQRGVSIDALKPRLRPVDLRARLVAPSGQV